jgi:tetratricopeptide (TPR) repeat protein
MAGWRSRLVVIVGMALFVWFALCEEPRAVQAQVPDTFKNLEVLPKNISRGELVSVMRSYASALGVRCAHCHVGADAPNLKGADFASDTKEQKRTARLMIRMVREINDGHISKLGPDHTTRVECVTCHRGLASPRTLGADLMGVLDSKGREAAVARYRELRASSYGRGGYDFGQGTLNALGEQLLGRNQPADALALLTLNREFFPGAAWTRYLLGEAHRALGHRQEAITEYEKSTALEPQNPMARQRLQEMAASPSPVP